MSKYYLNGIDLESIGVIVESGSDDFLQLPETKPIDEYAWPELNGVEVDLSQPLLFKDREITLKMAIVAYSETDFWNNYNTFINTIRSPGTKRLYVEELSRSFFLYYVKSPSFRRLSPIKGSTKIGAKYEVTFREPVPSLLKPYAFLTTKTGVLITSTKGQLINTNP